MTLFKELYGTGRLVSDWAADIRRHSAGMKIEATIADHDAEDRATLDAAGIPTIPAYKAVTPGIEAVQKRLRKEGDGRPRLLFAADAIVRRDPRPGRGPQAHLHDRGDRGLHVGADGSGPGAEGRASQGQRSRHGRARYACAYVDGLGGAGDATWGADPLGDDWS
jgi:hypothetical protein